MLTYGIVYQDPNSTNNRALLSPVLALKIIIDHHAMRRVILIGILFQAYGHGTLTLKPDLKQTIILAGKKGGSYWHDF